MRILLINLWILTSLATVETKTFGKALITMFLKKIRVKIHSEIIQLLSIREETILLTISQTTEAKSRSTHFKMMM